MSDLLEDFHSNDRRESGDVYCPCCNTKFAYKPYSVEEQQKELQVYSNGAALTCSAEKCKGSSGASMFTLSCGHLTCTNDYESSRNGNCSKCTSISNDSDKADGTRIGEVVESRHSHQAQMVFISGSETCPICFEDFSSGGDSQDSSSPVVTMALLSCGHVVCVPCFKKLGGKVGEDALISVEEEARRRQERTREFRNHLGTVVVTDMVRSLRTAIQENDAEEIETKLDILAMYIGCAGPGEPQAFVSAGGPDVVLGEVIGQFTSPRITRQAFETLINLFCPEHVSPDLQKNFGQRIIQNHPDIIPTCVAYLTNDSTPMFLLVGVCHFLGGLFKHIQADIGNFESIVRAGVTVINGKHLDVPALAYHSVSMLLSLFGHCEDGGESSKPYDQVTVVVNAHEAIMSIMRKHEDNEEIQGSCIGALCHASFGAKGGQEIRRAGGIECVCNTMKHHGDNWMVQRNGCNFLWSMGNCAKNEKKTTEDALISNGALLCIKDCMIQFQDAPIMVAAPLSIGACSAMENLGHKLKGIPLALARAGCVETVAGVLERFGSIEYLPIVFQAIRAIQALASSEKAEIRLALVSSKAIIPALQKLASEIRKYCMSDSSDMGSANPFMVMQADDLVGGVLDNLGVRDINMMFDDEYDFDQEEPEQGSIEDPPFDVTCILNKDLSADDVDGWYKGNPFHVDYHRSALLAKRHDKPFYVPPTAPEVENNVCIRISLPYGGRGYLYGTITEVWSAPTDEELRESGSVMFEKPCPCPRPDCRLKNGSREEIVAVCGVVHGQKCTARVQLGSPYLERKLRFGPLPKFFLGEETQYDCVLRFDDGGRQWEGIHISKVGDQE